MIPGGLTQTRLTALVVMALYHKFPGRKFSVEYRDDNAFLIDRTTKEYVGATDLLAMGINPISSVMYHSTEQFMSIINKRLCLILASDMKLGIGFQGQLPWRCPSDLQNFKAQTAGKVVIMGRKTFESLPPKGLPGRILIVVSSSMRYQVGQNFKLVTNLKEAIALAEFISEDRYFVIGGEKMYEEAFPLCSEVHYTLIEETFTCDRHAMWLNQLTVKDEWEHVSANLKKDTVEGAELFSVQGVWRRK